MIDRYVINGNPSEIKEGNLVKFRQSFLETYLNHTGPRLREEDVGLVLGSIYHDVNLGDDQVYPSLALDILVRGKRIIVSPDHVVRFFDEDEKTEEI